MYDKALTKAITSQVIAPVDLHMPNLVDERFHFLAQFSTDWYWEQDSNYRFTYFARNEGSEASFPAQRSLGKTRWEIAYEDISEHFWDEHRRDLDARRPFHNLILKRRTSNGDLRYTSISGAPILNAMGIFTGYRGIGRDVTEQLAANQRQMLEHRITRILSDSNNVEVTISKIIETICTTLDWDFGSYFVLDGRRDRFVRASYWHRTDLDISDFMQTTIALPTGFDPDDKTDESDGLVRRAWATRELVWVDVISSESNFTRSNVARKAGLNAAFALPIICSGAVFGVLDFFRRHPCQMSQQLSETLMSIGHQVALFLQRKQVEERQTMQNIVTRILADADTLDGVMPKIIETICATLCWDYGAYWEVDQAKNQLYCKAVWTDPHADKPDFVAWAKKTVIDIDMERFDASESVLKRLWLDHQPIWVADIKTEKSRKRGKANRSQLAVECDLHSLFAFPVLAGTKLIGLIEFFSHHIRQPGEMLIETARTIGIQIGLFYQRKKAEEQVNYLAYHDGMTGLLNRESFNVRLQNALHRASRDNRRIAVLFIDLDRFKIINDTLGHDTGDRLLREMAGRFKQCLRERNVIARFGGDEFVVLLENTGARHDLEAVADKLTLAARPPFTTPFGDCHITASIGISIYPDDGATELDLMKHADVAMYQAKNAGKNKYQFYSRTEDSHSLERFSLESGLRRALELGEFSLYYQPKISLADCKVVGMEALIRWNSSEMGIVSPAAFIPIAEEIGLINDIGRWVLHSACSQASAWMRQSGLPLMLSVNLSAGQFSDKRLFDQIATVLEETGFPPSCLDLEITESMVMRNPEDAVETLNRIRAMGVSVSMDDFGTGYSSLSQLIRFPINTIKIDRSFISSVTETSEHAAIATAIIAMSKALHLTVVAEGVETAGQMEFLLKHQCDQAQGFYFSAPLAADAFLKFLAPEDRQVDCNYSKREIQHDSLNFPLVAEISR